MNSSKYDKRTQLIIEVISVALLLGWACLCWVMIKAGGIWETLVKIHICANFLLDVWLWYNEYKTGTVPNPFRDLGVAPEILALTEVAMLLVIVNGLGLAWAAFYGVGVVIYASILRRNTLFAESYLSRLIAGPY